MKLLPESSLRCPYCGRGPRLSESSYLCSNCGHRYPISNHVLNFVVNSDKPRVRANERLWRGSRSDYPWRYFLEIPNLRLFEDAMSRLGLELGGRVIELGAGRCWAGALVKLRNSKVEMHATDISEEALSQGYELSRLMGASIDYFVASEVDNLPYGDNYFDHAMSVATLHHTPSPISALKEIWRVLKPKGTYIAIGEVAVSRFSAPTYRMIVGADWAERTLRIVERIYSFGQWERFFRETGFEFEISTYKNYRNIPNYNSLVRLLYAKTFGLLPDAFLKSFGVLSIVFVATKSSRDG